MCELTLEDIEAMHSVFEKLEGSGLTLEEIEDAELDDMLIEELKRMTIIERGKQTAGGAIATAKVLRCCNHKPGARGNAETGVSGVNKIEALLDLGDIALNAVEAPADTHSLSVVPKAREPRLHVLHV